MADVIGTIINFLPQKDLASVVKSKLKFGNYALLHRGFDLDDPDECRLFSDKDFDILVKNQILNRRSLFRCVVKRGLASKVKILLDEANVDDLEYAVNVASIDGNAEIVRELLKSQRLKSLENALLIAIRYAQPDVVELLIKDKRVNVDISLLIYAINFLKRYKSNYPSNEVEVVRILLNSKKVKISKGRLNRIIGNVNDWYFASPVIKDPRYEVNKKTLMWAHCYVVSLIPVILKKNQTISIPPEDDYSLDGIYGIESFLLKAAAEPDTLKFLLKRYSKIITLEMIYKTLVELMDYQFKDANVFLDTARMLLDWENSDGEKLDPAIKNNILISTAGSTYHFDLVCELLKYPQVDPRKKGILEDAVRASDLKTVKVLLDWEGPGGEKIDPRRTNIIIKMAIEENNLKIVNELLKNKIVNPNIALTTAIEKNKLEIVKKLLKNPKVNLAAARPKYYDDIKIIKNLLKLRGPRGEKFNPSVSDNLAIILASNHGDLELVKLLLKDDRVNPAANNNSAIVRAVSNGHLDVVRVLLKDPYINPAANRNEAIISIIKIENQTIATEMLKELLKDPRVDPSIDDNSLLVTALFEQKYQIANILLNDPKVRSVPISIDINKYNTDEIKMFLRHPKLTIEY